MSSPKPKTLLHTLRKASPFPVRKSFHTLRKASPFPVRKSFHTLRNLSPFPVRKSDTMKKPSASMVAFDEYLDELFLYEELAWAYARTDRTCADEDINTTPRGIKRNGMNMDKTYSGINMTHWDVNGISRDINGTRGFPMDSRDPDHMFIQDCHQRNEEERIHNHKQLIMVVIFVPFAFIVQLY